MRLAPLATLVAASVMALALALAPSARAAGVAAPSVQESGDS